MSEIQKHIESCRSEDPLAQTMEACGNESDLQAALQPLLVETMQGYVPVATTAPTSTIAELPNVLISIIRRVATKPLTMFGDRPAKQSLLGSLVTTWNAIRQRLAGNPSAGIPDRRADMSGHSLPTALALLNDRKITGVPEAEDGMSLVHLLGGVYSDVTELTDDNRGWTIRTDFINTLKSLFPNLTSLTLGFHTAGSRIGSNLSTFTELNFPGFELQTDGHLLEGNIGVEDLTIPVVQIKSTNNWTQSLLRNNSTTKILRCPRLKYMTNVIGTEHYGASKILVYDCNGIEEIYAEELEEFCSNINGAGGIASGAPNLKKVVVGNIRIWYCRSVGPYFFDNYRGTTYDNLLHLEFKSLNCSLNLKNWTAANVLQNNLQQFLLNFRDYIALRLANRKDTNALTLTLSAAVYNAVTGANSGWASLHTLADLGITTDDLTALEQELGITTATLYSTWLDTYTGANGIHWNVNKAN